MEVQPKWYQPIYIPDWHIYDCFYSDIGEFVIIMPAEMQPAPSIQICPGINNSVALHLNKCPHNHTYVYKLDAQRVNSILGQHTKNYPNTVTISIQNADANHKIEININKYPSYAGQLVMSTLVKHEDNIIRTWIDFHIRLGVQRFIIYDNAGTSESLESLRKVLLDYILDGVVILISWPYSYRLPISDISGQTTQQNHAIRAFNTARWIGLMDVDEFINIQRPDIIHNGGLCRFLDSMTSNYTKLGALRLCNKFFYNPENLPVDNGQFLQITNCANKVTKKGREKCFVNPSCVCTFSVHMITRGLRMITIPPRFGYFNHYCYLNKPDQKQKTQKQAPWHDSSITRYLPGSSPNNQFVNTNRIYCHPNSSGADEINSQPFLTYNPTK